MTGQQEQQQTVQRLRHSAEFPKRISENTEPEAN
jgi:hypothetical protein